MLLLCFYIWRVQHNVSDIQEKQKLDEYYSEELFETYKYNLDPIYSTLEEGYSDYIQEIEDSMRMDNYNTRQIKDLECKAYSKALRNMEKKDGPLQDQGK